MYKVVVLIEKKKVFLVGDSKEYPQASSLVDAHGLLGHDWYLL